MATKADLPQGIGDVEFYGLLTVKRIRLHVYTASVDGQRGSRWGTAQEILADINYFEQAGRLPRSQGQSWA